MLEKGRELGSRLSDNSLLIMSKSGLWFQVGKGSCDLLRECAREIKSNGERGHARRALRARSLFEKQTQVLRQTKAASSANANESFEVALKQARLFSVIRELFRQSYVTTTECIVGNLMRSVGGVFSSNANE